MHCSIVNTGSDRQGQRGLAAISTNAKPAPWMGAGWAGFDNSARSTERGEIQAASVKATPLVFSISWSSPDSYISRTMSQPPTNSPFT